MSPLLSILFGAKAQVAVGVATLTAGAFAWAWWSFAQKPTVAAIFHVSMFFGCVACYAIIATGLGFRATERVEQVVIENADIEVEK